ncbi:MAG: hypothetical protein ACOVJ5_00580 [Gloeomargaritales cyanobacterium]
MTEVRSLIVRLDAIAESIDLDNFYSIWLSPNSNQISLQGRFTDTTARFAKEISIKLEYQEENGMLKGESEDGKLRIVLT